MDSYVESARVYPDSQEAQSTLFPLSAFSRKPVTPRAFCQRINLNWLTAQRLFDQGVLSFDPTGLSELNPAQEAELNFLGRLAAGGCDEGLLKQMLVGLKKPYAYRLDRLFYNWETQCWDLTPNPSEREVQFEAWIEELVDTGQMPLLESLRAALDRSIADLRRLRYG